MQDSSSVMQPSSPGSVTLWITDLKDGDEHAAHELWDRYFAIADLARMKLDGFPMRVTDEEDVALSVIETLCRVPTGKVSNYRIGMTCGGC